MHFTFLKALLDSNQLDKHIELIHIQTLGTFFIKLCFELWNSWYYQMYFTYTDCIVNRSCGALLYHHECAYIAKFFSNNKRTFNWYYHRYKHMNINNNIFQHLDSSFSYSGMYMLGSECFWWAHAFVLSSHVSALFKLQK